MATAESKGRVAVAGEGPVGSLLALQLAARGFDVDVFERRPDMRTQDAGRGRSINLAVSTRGLHALAQAGLKEEVLAQAVPMRGRMMHAVSGALTFQPYGKDDSEHINSLSRAWLNKLLMTKAEASRRVKIRFQERVTGVDFRTGRLRLKNETTATATEVETEVVFGADGSGSAVRHDMMQIPRYNISKEYLEHGYKELTLPAAGSSTSPTDRYRIAGDALHIWPRGSFMLIALPNLDGSFTCTLFLAFEGAVSFERLDTPERVSAFFKEYFPDVVPLIPDLVEQFLENPTGHMVTIKCFPWSVEGRACLLGDAAHAVVPFYGQGMNCGFEDCTVLGESLDRLWRSPADWKAVFQDFSRRRKPDADAIADMAVENFIEMRDKVADPRFLLEKKVERVLQQRFPEEYIPRYSLVTFSRLPYRLAQRAGAVQSRILGELCRGIEREDQVDLDKASALIRKELAPVFAEARS